MMGLRSQAAWMIFNRVFMMILGVAQAYVVSRVLGPQGKGQLYFHMTITSTFPLFLTLGLPTANTYLLGKGLQTRDQLFQSSALVSVLGGGVAALLYLLVSGWYVGNEGLAVARFERLMFAALAATAVMQSIWPHFLQSEQRFVKSTLTNLISTTLYVLVAWPLYLQGVLSLKLLLLMLLGVQTLSVVLALVWILPVRLTGWTWGHFRQALGVGAAPLFSNLLQYGVYRVDSYFLGAMVTSQDLGYYSVAQSLSEMLWVLLAGAGILLPIQVRRSITERTELTQLVARLHMPVLVAAGVLLALFSKPLIGAVFSALFLPAAPLLWILIPGALSLGLQNILASHLGGRGRFDLTLRISGLAFGLNLVLNYPLISGWGITGAAVATSLSYLLGSGYALYAVIRLENITVASLLVLKRQDVDRLLAPLKERLRHRP